jgi:hypothetical protein
VATKKPQVYIDSCCFTELATFDRFSKVRDPDRLKDLRFIRALLESHLAGEVEVYTSTLSVAECQYVQDAADTTQNKVFDDEVRALFRSTLMSGRFAYLVQDSSRS